jgi:hypothetical protein
MAQHKGFACPACGAEFDTREQLENHNRKQHQQGGQAGAGGSAGSGSANAGGTNAGSGNKDRTGSSGM